MLTTFLKLLSTMPKPTFRALAILLLFIVVPGFLVFAGGQAQERQSARLIAAATETEANRTASQAAIAARLRARIAGEGEIRVIVGVRVPGVSGTVPANPNDQAEDAARRAAISQATQSVRTRMPATARGFRQFETLPFMAVSVDQTSLDSLMMDPAVESIQESFVLESALATSRPLVEADQAYAFGFSGSGQTVAILDSGVDRTHPSFGGRVVHEACFSGDGGRFTSVCPNSVFAIIGDGAAAPCTFDTVGCAHGTHVAGIAAGATGVAKDSSIIAVQVASKNSFQMTWADADVIAGLQHVYSLRSQFNIAAVNLSLGANGQAYPLNCDTESPIFTSAINNLRNAGIATVVASGNNEFANGMTFPSCISTAISVGNTTKSDIVNPESNSSSVLSLLAPGTDIYSAVPGGGFEFGSGTSMAAPHVTGAWAILKQKSPFSSVLTILAALQTTGKPIVDTRNGRLFNRIRIRAALTAGPSVVTNAASAIGLTQATVSGTVNPMGGETTLVFDYGLTPSYGNTAFAGSVGSGTADVTHVATVTGLSCGTTYHYRARAYNIAGSSVGEDRTFTTTGSCSVVADSFNPGANGAVLALAVQPDGKVLVGGAFTTLGNLSGGGGTGSTDRRYLARLNADGQLDAGFDPQPNSGIWGLAIQPDGKILVVGTFSRIAGQFRSHIARLNCDGTLDTTFELSAALPGPWIQALALQPDGKVLIGGFGSVLRLNTDGSRDTTFSNVLVSKTSSHPDEAIFTLAVQADGRILIGGGFASVNSRERWNIARLNENGTVDDTFDAGATMFEAACPTNPFCEFGRVHSIALDANGKILVGGLFSKLGGGKFGQQAQATFGRLTSSGSPDLSFVPMLSNQGGVHLTVNASLVQADGRILIAGTFETLDGLPRAGIGRLMPNGSVDPQFDAGVNAPVRGMALLGDGKILLGGEFTRIGGGGTGTTPRSFIGRVNNTTVGEQVLDRSGIWTRMGGVPEVSRVVFESSDDGITFTPIGTGTRTPQGWIGPAGQTTKYYRARGFADGSGPYASVGSVYESVLTPLVVQPAMAVVDSFDPGINHHTYAMAVQPDGKVLIGGSFSTLGGGGTGSVTRHNIGRLNPDGTLDASFNPGTNGVVNAIAIQPDGKILIGGYFSTVGGGGMGTTARNRLARLNQDGSVDSSFNPGANDAVVGFAQQPDGKIIVVGTFTMLGGGGIGTTARSRIGRLNANGTIDAGFNPGANSGVFGLALQPDGKVLVGGQFTMLGGGSTGTTARSHIGRLNGDGSVDFAFNPGADSNVLAISVQYDGRIIVGGQFTRLGGGGSGTTPRAALARLLTDGTVDLTFAGGADHVIYSTPLQANGSVLASGIFTNCACTPRKRIARFGLAGNLDATFDPGANEIVYGLVVQPDAQILAGGAFTTLGGGGTGLASRNGIGRITGAGTSSQSVVVSSNGSVIDWFRFNGPEVNSAVFEISADGITYKPLGAGIRVPGGWRLTGQAIPAGSFVRARGIYRGGLFNGSESIVEAIRPGLSPGQISGLVTDVLTNAGLPNITVQVFNQSGSLVKSEVTSAEGLFTVRGLASSGLYFARTVSPLVGGQPTYVDELHNDIPCIPSCPVTTGTSIVVSPGATTVVDFALAPPGTVTGTVTATGSNAPIQGISVTFYTFAGVFAKSSSTTSAGTYEVKGLAPGLYYARTSDPGQNYLDELWENLPCGPSCVVTNGIPITVQAGSIKTGIDFSLGSNVGIAGTVVGPGGAPLAGVTVQVHASSGTFANSGTTDSAGAYTIKGLQTGSYFARTSVSASQNYQNQLYAGIPCSFSCNVTQGTSIAVTLGQTTSNINFSLSGGGTVAGTVTDASNGTPLSNVGISLYGSTGDLLRSMPTSGAGTFSFTGLPAGSYFARTVVASGQNYINELFNNISCATSCTVTSGTAITIAVGATAVANIGLTPGQAMTGIVTNALSAAPLAGVQIKVFDSSGQQVKSATTNGAGLYSVAGLATGSYFVATQSPMNAFFLTDYLDELYDNIPCSFCNPLAGHPVAVTAGVPTANINFALTPVARISGTVTDASTGLPLGNVSVTAATPSGQFVGFGQTDGTGAYSIRGLPAGQFFIATSVDTNHINERYPNVQCVPDCAPQSGTAVQVSAGGVINGINFALDPGGVVTGVVTAETGGTLLENISVQIFTSSGIRVRTVSTDETGVYRIEGLTSGSYYARTSEAGSQNYIDELFNGASCFPGCTLQQGTAFAVTAGLTTGGINFSLVGGGAIAGTLTAAGNGQPVLFGQVKVYTSTGSFVAYAFSDETGAFTVGGLVPGTYFARTALDPSEGFVNQLYGGGVCLASCSVTNGSPIPVVGTDTTHGVSFALEEGGSIAGTVTDAASGTPVPGNIRIYAASTGLLAVETYLESDGTYLAAGLPAGAYVARTFQAQGHADELYGGLACLGNCNVSHGTPIDVVAGSMTGQIDFALEAAGNVTGLVIDASTGVPLGGIAVQLYTANGDFAVAGITEDNGTFAVRGVPAATYFARTNNSSGYVDALYANQLCVPSCTNAITSGTPIVIVGAGGASNVNFALPPGGRIAGQVTSAAGGAPLAQVVVNVYSSNGALVATAVTGASGGFVTASGLPTGTYFARTSNVPGFLDEVYDNQFFCFPNCLPTAGTAIQVTAGITTGGIDFALSPGGELIRNGDFSNGTSFWALFATPNLSYLAWKISEPDDDDEGMLLRGGVFQYYRVPPPPGTSNSAVILQSTGTALPIDTPLLASFELGNSSTSRKRISVLIHDGDFTDLSVCTFWLEPGARRISYGMRTRNTKAWSNATISFYAASAGSDGGFYELDNVSLRTTATASSQRSDCIDPTLAPPSSGPDGPELIVNGDFSGGGLAGWSTFGQITHQIAGGAFEFYRPTAQPDPAGVILQPAGATVAAGEMLTARFELGNSSSVRKRVTVLLHDLNFSDLAACTFWLEPGQALSAYAMQAFATRPWTNATFSLYAATVGNETWTRLDNVSLRKTPGAAMPGTTCVEPGASTATVRLAPDTGGALLRELSAQGESSPLYSALQRPESSIAGADFVGGIEVASVGLLVDAILIAADSGLEIQFSLDRHTWHNFFAFMTLHGRARAQGDLRLFWEAVHVRIVPRRNSQ